MVNERIMNRKVRMWSMLLVALTMGSLTVKAGDGSRLSVDLKRLVARQHISRRAAGPDKVCAFVKFKHGDAGQLLAQYGCQEVTQIGHIHIANIPLAQLEALSADAHVERVEAQLDGKLLNDITPQWVNSTSVHSGVDLPQGYDGSGVLVGIVDSGFDMTHPTLYSEDGETYRIKVFVDEMADDEETKGIPTPIGREYTTQEEILTNNHVGDFDMLHATHCIGTAAGSGYGTPYRGIAYGADIFAVSSRNAGNDYYMNTADQAARMKRIFDYAEAHHQPCVITYSIGFNDIPGDSRLFSEALEQLVGPGKILVAAAGNESSKNTYVNKPQGKETAGAVLACGKQPSRVFLQSGQPFKLKCLTASLNQAKALMELTDSIVFDTDELPHDTVVFRGHHIMVEKDGPFYTLTDRWEDAGLGDHQVLALAIEGEDAAVEMFLSTESEFSSLAEMLYQPRFLCAIRSHNISLPGSLPSVVTVGALNGRESYINANNQKIEGYGTKSPVGTIAFFSSVGPTHDGRLKPDVVAPGVNIISAGNSFCASSYTSSMVAKTVFHNREYPWQALSGTSMATPCVAGIVALWLQANPHLSPDDVKAIIKATSRKPEESLDYPNNTYGYGLIDAYAGIREILKDVTGIQHVETSVASGSDEWYTLYGTRLDGQPTAKGIYIHQGRKVVVE